MSSRELEEHFVETFVRVQLRERWREMLHVPKKRAKLLVRLYHHLDFTAETVRALPRAASGDYTALPALLARLGAAGSVSVISANSTIDGALLSFAEATAPHSGCAWATGTVCTYVSGKLAVWTDEYGQQTLLNNSAAANNSSKPTPLRGAA